ncbi:sodium-dependent transporter [uncultured Desulfovibrio sp.]|uniref:sodium-dependent transporter n=1 Tax=uncultured Desulfovibrio sp. TaxID=167968 RepID=UPI00261664E3|nr:sodium-dependent transporter [uncultured Desulfovibrio sp.]
MAEKKTREMLSSRLGFLLLSAGCAIGLGNVWRFPYITGNYGGAIFVGIFLICLLAVVPIMIMEFAVGRAARRNMGLAFGRLEPEGTHWHRFGWWALVGSYVLMMFYTVVTGWMLLYCWYTASGALSGLQPTQVGAFFGEVLGSAGTQVLGMTLVVLIGSGICAMGVQKGVERVVKLMMVGLVLILLVLVVRALLLPGAMEGVRFYLVPDVDRFLEKGVFNVISAAMNQSFFCLSVGIGAMTIFGSYQSKERALTGEALWITLFNTLVGIFAGLIIFPACFSFGVSPNSGPGLVFVTLPNIFNNMFLGRLWGTLFFILMAFAALSTVIAVFENIISYSVDVWGMPRRRAVVLHLIGLWVLSLPCALGFNVWSDFQPFGAGTSVLDLEDFIISNHMLPLGGLFFLLFCCIRYGWGWDKFIAETDTGEGMKFPAWLRPYLTYILPLVILFLFVMGYVDRFGGK